MSSTASTEVLPDTEARRLLWRCRRGMKELDLVLERFARRELLQTQAGTERRRLLDRLLELPDPLLLDYLLGQRLPPEVELAELILKIRTLPPELAAQPGGTVS